MGEPTNYFLLSNRKIAIYTGYLWFQYEWQFVLGNHNVVLYSTLVVCSLIIYLRLKITLLNFMSEDMDTNSLKSRPI